MESVMLLFLFMAVGITGFFVMRKLDDFLEENRNFLQDTLEDSEEVIEVTMEEKSRKAEGLLQTANPGMKQERLFNMADVIKSIGMIVLASAIGFGFWRLGMSEANIIMVYILGVLITSVITTHQIFILIASIVTVFVFNFLFA